MVPLWWMNRQDRHWYKTTTLTRRQQYAVILKGKWKAKNRHLYDSSLKCHGTDGQNREAIFTELNIQTYENIRNGGFKTGRDG
jgi:hypothetical protein